MKIRAIIIDSAGNEIQTIISNFNSGVFKFKVNTFFGFGGQEKTIPCDITNAPLLKGKGGTLPTVWFKYDGNERTQTKLGSNNQPFQVSQFLQSVTNDILAEQVALDKPQNNTQLLNTLLWLITIIAIIGVYMMSNNVATNAQKIFQPVSDTLAQNHQLILTLQNNTQLTYKLANGTLNYLRVHGG